MVIDLNRILVGLGIVTYIFLCFSLNLHYVLLYTIFFLILFDLIYSKFSFKYILLIPISLYLLINIDKFFLINLFIFISFLIFAFLTLFKKFLHLLFIILISFFIYFNYQIYLYDFNLIYQIIIVSFLNDTLAYIFGKTIKGPLIIPSISPKKTWSGTIFSLFFSSLFLYKLGYSLFLSVLLGILFFLGDIFFSFIKRNLNIKDFSNLLSNHGGILDRLDSMFFVSSAYFIIFTL